MSHNHLHVFLALLRLDDQLVEDTDAEGALGETGCMLHQRGDDEVELRFGEDVDE